jgi:hypothetical protein
MPLPWPSHLIDFLTAAIHVGAGPAVARLILSILGLLISTAFCDGEYSIDRVTGAAAEWTASGRKFSKQQARRRPATRPGDAWGSRIALRPQLVTSWHILPLRGARYAERRIHLQWRETLCRRIFAGACGGRILDLQTQRHCSQSPTSSSCSAAPLANSYYLPNHPPALFLCHNIVLPHMRLLSCTHRP